MAVTLRRAVLVNVEIKLAGEWRLLAENVSQQTALRLRNRAWEINPTMPVVTLPTKF